MALSVRPDRMRFAEVDFFFYFGRTFRLLPGGNRSMKKLYDFAKIELLSRLSIGHSIGRLVDWIL